MRLEVTKNTENARDLYVLEWFNETGESLRKIQLYNESFKALEEYFRPKVTVTKVKREKRQPAIAPTIQEVKDYFKSEGYTEDTAIRFHKYYESLDWFDANGKPVLRWKSKAVSTWMKPENRIKEEKPKDGVSFFR